MSNKEEKNEDSKQEEPKSLTWNGGYQGFQAVGSNAGHNKDDMCLIQKTNNISLREVLLLDSGSSFSMMVNEDLVKGVTLSKRPIEMGTNNGSKLIDKEGEVPGINQKSGLTVKEWLTYGG